MSKGDLSIIDTSKWKAVQSPGLKAPRHQLSYDSVEIQHVLAESFGAMFPSIVEEKNGIKRYSFLNKAGVDQFSKLKPAKNIGDIPRAEMLRLMEGWIRLRRKLQEEAVPSKVGSILLNFRVPNPRESLDRYMLYKVGDEERLVIRWGYETKDDRAVSLERAISILMDVPLGHMRSILSTTMTATTATVPVGQMLTSATSQVNNGVKSAPQRKVIVGIALAACSTLVLGGILISKEIDPRTELGVPAEVTASLVKDESEITSNKEPDIEEAYTQDASKFVVVNDQVDRDVRTIVEREPLVAGAKNNGSVKGDLTPPDDLLVDFLIAEVIEAEEQSNDDFTLDSMVSEEKIKESMLDDMMQ